MMNNKRAMAILSLMTAFVFPEMAAASGGYCGGKPIMNPSYNVNLVRFHWGQSPSGDDRIQCVITLGGKSIPGMTPFDSLLIVMDQKDRWGHSRGYMKLVIPGEYLMASRRGANPDSKKEWWFYHDFSRKNDIQKMLITNVVLWGTENALTYFVKFNVDNSVHRDRMKLPSLFRAIHVECIEEWSPPPPEPPPPDWDTTNVIDDPSPNPPYWVTWVEDGTVEEYKTLDDAVKAVRTKYTSTRSSPTASGYEVYAEELIARVTQEKPQVNDPVPPPEEEETPPPAPDVEPGSQGEELEPPDPPPPPLDDDSDGLGAGLPEPPDPSLSPDDDSDRIGVDLGADLPPPPPIQSNGKKFLRALAKNDPAPEVRWAARSRLRDLEKKK